MDEELKPCPFCGGEAKVLSDSGRHGEVFSVFHQCKNEDGKFNFNRYGSVDRTTIDTGWYDTEQEAIEAWNTRTERTCTDERYAWCMFECSECGCECEGGDYEGHNCSTGAFNYCPNCGARVMR